jgi:hypothetical protein
MMQMTDKIMSTENDADQKAYFLEIIAKRVVAHYYKAIVNLSAALIKQPVVAGEEACRLLFQDCLRMGPVNSIPVFCACHTDPLKPFFDEAFKDARAS